MAVPNAENQKLMDDMAAQGVNVGTVYKIAAHRGTGSQCVYTDAGEFYTLPGVPGAYYAPDARAKPPFRNLPA